MVQNAGTLLTAQLALEHGLACNTAGGTHHAQHAAGSGFCIINDLAITARLLRSVMPQRVQRILILDLDVHQGDGTAEILSPSRGGIPAYPSPFSTSSSLHSQNISSPASASATALRSSINSNQSQFLWGPRGGVGLQKPGPEVRSMNESSNLNQSVEAGVSGVARGEGIFTCSVHAERNFPARKRQSTLDVGLPDSMGDQEYIRWVVTDCISATSSYVYE